MKDLRFISVLVFGAAMILSVPAGGALFAAERAAVAEQAAAALPVTLKLSIVISRFEGDKVGSLPFGNFMIVPSAVPAASDDPRAIRDGDQTSLQMGSDFPVLSTTTTDGKTVASYMYRSLGTNITASGRMLDESRFNVSINVQDSQLMSEPTTSGAAGRSESLARFQNFRSQNRLIMRDGQTIQYTAAADKVSGEVVKLDVTLNVIK